ncbi:hypothetical protein EVAR_51429_1 [Eumeta japonica]|uniref:Uncharacterized protein n=1 Tax=Eumeta variegata TaxID=151549 RepID=A0A4C1XUY4_EUMVA|nr:hypothetical protein EVAR_51429_1 [Eumeta japonica]
MQERGRKGQEVLNLFNASFAGNSKRQSFTLCTCFFKKLNSIARPNGRYRAPAPSALTKLFAFCADRRPATLPALLIESPRRRPPPRSTTNNNLLFQRASGAGLSPSGNGKPRRTWDHWPWRVLLADIRCRPPTPSSLTPSSVPVCWVNSRPSSDTELLEPLGQNPRAPYFEFKNLNIKKDLLDDIPRKHS